MNTSCGPNPDAVHVGVQIGNQREQPLKRVPAGLLAAQGAHHRLGEHDVVAPQRLVLGQVGRSPRIGEPFGELRRELRVNRIDGHGIRI
jgi:hypothetical protein